MKRLPAPLGQYLRCWTLAAVTLLTGCNVPDSAGPQLTQAAATAVMFFQELIRHALAAFLL